MDELNILDFIDSEDIREYNKDTLFSPTQKALLIGHSKKQTIEKKIKAMDRLLLEYLDWDFPYIDADDKKQSFRKVITEEVKEWKEVLEKRYDNREAVYISRLSEVEFLSSDEGNPRFFSNYAKAYESLVIAKKRYLDDLDLKDVQTLGEIIRITVDAGNASYGYDERHYLFDTDMRLIDVYRKCHEDNCLVNGMDAYRCYIPVPFKAGDIVKCVSPYHETYYGVFPYDWEEPKNKYGISMYASLDTYYAKEKLFEITDETPVLELSKCEDDELPEDQRILKVISAIRKGNLDFYTVLNQLSFHRLDDIVTWFYKK